MVDLVTVIINTYNEEKTIEACIESARLLSNCIVVVDMNSTDKTTQIVQSLEIPLYSFPHSRYVEPARNYGVQKAQTEWVFFLDADERITPEFAHEVINTISSTAHTYFKISRKNIFAGKHWLRHGGWWPDLTTGRLLKKSSFRSWPSEIHSTPLLNGTVGKLSTSFLHFFHGNLSSMVDKTLVYENIEADLLYKAGRNVTIALLFRKCFAEFFRRYLQKAGFLDGTYGVIESVYQAYSKAITWLFLFEKKLPSKN